MTEEKHSCRSCIHCDWRGQYCKERDADMSPVFMRTPKSCLYYSQINEPEIPLT